jgi:hypothetical protein
MPLLLVFSLYHLSGHLSEQRRRDLVLAQGHEAQALVREPTGIEFVTVEWSDAGGRTRTGLAWTGKVFARQFRDGSAFSGQGVRIKYLDDAAVEPVIISQAAERQRVNNWWIYADGFVALWVALVCAAVGFAILRSRRSP